MVRTFAACGLHRGDVIQNAYGYGLFTGGLGAHYGAEALGATVIPISGGNTERQLMVLQDFRVTAICCTSYMLHLVERAHEAGISFERLKVGVFGAEPWSEEMRRTSRRTGIRAHDIYGLSEIIGPGVGSSASGATASTCSRITSSRRSSTPTREVLPDGAEGGSSSPRSRRRRCR